MKKNYIAPSMEIAEIELQQMVAVSSQRVYTEFGINYGGIDEDGELDPASRRNNNLWDDEEDDWD